MLVLGVLVIVSPTSIRSRILKVDLSTQDNGAFIVSPTSIRSRILKGRPSSVLSAAHCLFHPRRSVRGY